VGRREPRIYKSPRRGQIDRGGQTAASEVSGLLLIDIWTRWN
jgi:hypothetical protein